MMFHETHNLAGYLEGSLPADASARVERHLENCAHCRAALADMRAAKHVLSAAGQAVTPVHYDSQLWSRVHAQIATPHRQAPLRPRWALAGGGLALGAAAVWLGVMASLPHPGVSPTSGPMISVVPPSTPRDRGFSQSRRPMVKAPESVGSKTVAPHAAPTVEAPQPMETATPPVALAGRPMLARESSPAKSRQRRDVKQMMAKADTGPATLSYGAAAGPDQTARPTGGALDGFAERPSYATKSAATLDTQNTPSTHQYYSPTDKAIAKDELTHALPVAAPPPAPDGPKAGVGLDIVADASPSVPKSVGLGGQVNERAMVAKAKPSQSPVAATRSLAPLGVAKVRSGVSTVEGHRLYTEADDALRAGKEAKASGYYAKAIESGLDSVECRASEMRLGDIALKANDAATAARWYRAAASQSKDAEVLTKLGDALERTGDAKGASEAYRQALAISPAFPAAKAGLERVKSK